MSYITDNPWPLLILLVAIAVIAFLSGNSKGRTVGLICLLLAGGLYFLEQSIISPGEEIEREVATMLDNFKASDIDAITSQICQPQDKLVGIAQQGLSRVELDDSFAIKSVKVTLNSETSATAMVRANGKASDRQGGSGLLQVASFWRTEWRLEDGLWKLAAATRLHPLNGTEMGHFSVE